MLEKMLNEGRKEIVKRCADVEGSESLREDQILAYFRYPPSYYHLRMHFMHVDLAAHASNHVGRTVLALGCDYESEVEW